MTQAHTHTLTIDTVRTPSGMRFYPKWDGKPFTRQSALSASNANVRSVISFATRDEANDFLWSNDKIFV